MKMNMASYCARYAIVAGAAIAVAGAGVPTEQVRYVLYGGTSAAVQLA